MSESTIAIPTPRDLANNKRVAAKRILGELVERGGYLNDQLPMSRFVDTLIDAVVLELAAVNYELRSVVSEPTDKPN